MYCWRNLKLELIILNVFSLAFIALPRQSLEETNNFLHGFEQTCSCIALESPLCSFIIGDLNAKSTNWWPNGNSNPCGMELFDLTNILGYSQLINEATNFEPNKSP